MTEPKRVGSCKKYLENQGFNIRKSKRRSKRSSKRRSKRSSKRRSKRSSKRRSKRSSKRRSKRTSKRRSKRTSKRRSKRSSKRQSKRSSKIKYHKENNFDRELRNILHSVHDPEYGYTLELDIKAMDLMNSIINKFIIRFKEINGTDNTIEQQKINLKKLLGDEEIYKHAIKSMDNKKPFVDIKVKSKIKNLSSTLSIVATYISTEILQLAGQEVINDNDYENDKISEDLIKETDIKKVINKDKELKKLIYKLNGH